MFSNILATFSVVVNRFLARAFVRLHVVDRSSPAHSQFIGRLSHRHFSPVENNEFIAPRIRVLRNSGSPNAIFGLVVPVILNSLYRMTIRALPHILKKIFERVPPIAYRNSSSSVVWVACCARILAPLMHINPYRICASFRHSVTSVAARLPFFIRPSGAPTGSSVSVSKACFQNGYLCTAIANGGNHIESCSPAVDFRISSTINSKKAESFAYGKSFSGHLNNI